MLISIDVINDFCTDIIYSCECTMFRRSCAFCSLWDVRYKPLFLKLPDQHKLQVIRRVVLFAVIITLLLIIDLLLKFLLQLFDRRRWGDSFVFWELFSPQRGKRVHILEKKYLCTVIYFYSLLIIRFILWVVFFFLM